MNSSSVSYFEIQTTYILKKQVFIFGIVYDIAQLILLKLRQWKNLAPKCKVQGISKGKRLHSSQGNSDSYRNYMNSAWFKYPDNSYFI